MTDAESKLTLLERREIEAKILGPVLRAVIAEVGEDRAKEILREVVSGLAREAGAAMARSLGESSLPAFSSCLDRWKAGGALELVVLRSDAEHLDFDVTRCRYAELYRDLGISDLGGDLSCVRDHALVEGFNPSISLERTQTIMAGAPYCNFRFSACVGASTEPSSPPAGPDEGVGAGP